MTFKRSNIYAALLSFLMIVAALWIQLTYQLEPCPLCITQRIIFIVLGLLFVFFVWLPLNFFVRIIYLLAIGITSIVGLIFSARHVLIQQKYITVPAECGIDLDYMFENFPLMEAFNLLFQGTGDCSKVDWTFYGLSLPMMAFLGYLFFLIYALFIFKKIKK
ncbi:MAG: disulfide bond formation protein B [Methylophilaceae bacterium]|jgi:disulfide bond formation protein DsbB